MKKRFYAEIDGWLSNIKDIYVRHSDNFNAGMNAQQCQNYLTQLRRYWSFKFIFAVNDYVKHYAIQNEKMFCYPLDETRIECHVSSALLVVFNKFRQKGDLLTVYGLIYSVKDGLLKDLKVNFERIEDINEFDQIQ